jgi:hypothetical protein
LKQVHHFAQAHDAQPKPKSRGAMNRNVVNLSKKEAFWAIHVPESGFSGFKDFPEKLNTTPFRQFYVVLPTILMDEPS